MYCIVVQFCSNRFLKSGLPWHVTRLKLSLFFHLFCPSWYWIFNTGYIYKISGAHHNSWSGRIYHRFVEFIVVNTSSLTFWPKCVLIFCCPPLFLSVIWFPCKPLRQPETEAVIIGNVLHSQLLLPTPSSLFSLFIFVSLLLCPYLTPSPLTPSPLMRLIAWF